MRTWNVESSTRDGHAAADAAIRLFGGIGSDCFDEVLLEAVNASVAADAVFVYRLTRDGPPRRYCSANRGKDNSTDPCWKAYREGIYLMDETFDEVWDRVRSSSFVIGHLTAQEVRCGVHRQTIYDRHQLLDRLSVSGLEPNGDLLALNVYRRRSEGHFLDREMARFEEVSAVLLSAVRRHGDLASGTSEKAADSTPARITHFERMLQRERPELTSRELSVCARLLVGMLYEGIAADLGVGITTVKTYRKRAFERLGIHFRNELLAIALEARRLS
jgi:DNA-binding CsgD family transcriptional regulator